MTSCEMMFEKFTKVWRKCRKEWSSIVKDHINHWSYRQIIKLGPPVIPLILKELKTHDELWFPALEEITGENPVPDSDKGKIKKMVEDWLNWGREKGFLIS